MIDSSILLSSEVLSLLNGQYKGQTFANKWYERALVKTYYYLGFFQMHKGEPSLPMEYFNKSLDISNRINYLYGQSLAFGGMGTFYMHRGDNAKALEYYFKALKIDELRHNDEGILVRLSNISNIYMNRNDYTKAEDFLLRAMKLAEGSNDKKHMSILLGNLGVIYYQRQDKAKAIEYYQKALAIDSEIDNKTGMSIQLNNLGSLYKDNKDYEKAYGYFNEALSLAREQSDRNMEGSLLGNLGVLFKHEKKYAKAEEYLLKALEIGYELQALDIVSEFEKELSDLYTIESKDKQALEHYKKYTAAKDSIANEQVTEKTVRAEMNYEFEKKEAAARAEHEREIIALEAESKIQKQLDVFLVVAIILILVTLFFVKRAYDNKKRIATFLESETQRKEVLLQEVHHRINNNLQIISSLLSLQANSAKDERLFEYLQQSQNRIQSLSSLHELLYQTDSPLEINMHDYLDRVLSFHRDVLSTKDMHVTINNNIDAVSFPTKAAVPIALIVNELVTNSIKYAFNGLESGSITVSLYPEKEKPNSWLLHVSDNGKGLPDESNMRKNSLGLRLVNIMTRQVNGMLTSANVPGASFTLSFSLAS